MIQKIFIGACALLSALCVLLSYQLVSARIELSQAKLAHSLTKLTHAEEMSKTLASHLDDLDRINNLQDKARDANIAEKAQLRTAADRAATAHAGLRNELARLRAGVQRGQENDPRTVGGGTTVEGLADVLDACVAEYRILAIQADDAHSAGGLCESLYDALNEPSPEGKE